MRSIETFFPPVNAARLLDRLHHPTSAVDVVVDTDAFNGIDDQFALAYLLRSDDRCRVQMIAAAPFYNPPESGRVSHSTSPADGMERSYEEILRVLDAAGRADLKPFVFRGATHYLPGPLTPVPSEAADQIVTLARAHSPENPLYILAIACATNVASALLTAPDIRDRIVVVWQGGQSRHFGTCDDFNLSQDIHAGRVLFGCGAALVQLPLLGVVSEFRFTRPELETLLGGQNALCDFLLNLTWAHTALQFNYPHWSKALVDMTAAAWLVSDAFFLERVVPSPVPQYDLTFSFPPDRHPIRYVYYVKKDPLVADMVAKLTR